jgi:hypothetical protein
MNTIYDIARSMFAKAQINWTTAPLRLLGYSGNPEFIATDDVIADITLRGNTLRIGVSLDIAAQNVSAEGYLMTDNVVLPAVPIGYPLTHMIMVSMPGSDPEAAMPILFIDDAEDLPFTPNGLDIVITPDWLLHRGWGRL